MKRISAIIVLLSFSCIHVFAQLQVNTGLTASQLVYNTLIGNGVSASNVTFTGDPIAIGSFSGGGTTNLGLVDGILLTSGDASLAPGPNSSSSQGYNNSGTSDPQLSSLISATLHDAAVIEFDFVPLADTLRFRYVFGSDEYPEFSGSSYNDVFGFFISGPNPAGGNYVNQNVATIPGQGTTPVSINNINNGTNNAGPCVNCSFYVDNSSGQFIEYDAFTVVMVAEVVVIPCQTYHFKIAISDAGDGSYDSGVFLEANSFSTGHVSITPGFSTPNAFPVGIEDCNGLEISGTLPDYQPQDYIVVFDTMWGTATNGVDFNHVSDTFIIPAGQLVGTKAIFPIQDNITEPTEDWNIVIRTSPCTVDTITFDILDYKRIEITNMVNDTSLCSDSTYLFVDAINGHQPLMFDWNPGGTLSDSTTANPMALPTNSTNYIVTVYDTTGCPAAVDSVLVNNYEMPNVSFMMDAFNGCEPLEVNFQNFSTPANNSYLWEFGDGNTSTAETPTHTYAAGLFDVKLTATTANGCVDSIIFNDIIEAYPSPTASFTATPDVVSVDDPTIQFNNQSSNNTHNNWSFGDGNTSNAIDPLHTYPEGSNTFTVWLIVSTDDGCIDSTSLTTRVVVDEIGTYNIITPNGDGRNDYFYIENIEFVEYSHLKIYNRWGKKVFDAENYQNDWNGEGLADGVYFYTLEYKTYFREDVMSGSVTIIRN